MKSRYRLSLFLLLFLTVFFLLGFLFLTKGGNMKDLSNVQEEEVRSYAKKEGLILQVKKEYHDTILKGNVISQSIPAGAKIKKKDSLTVTISLGKIDVDLYKSVGVNELGYVPIMMYHGIHNLKNEDTNYTKGNVDKDGYQRTAEAFREDLEKYYHEGYRMIALKDYVDGMIDVPLGKSPIILTFDDGLKNNIAVTGLDHNGEIMIDPNSAVGILEEYKKKYPDFQVTATFFINAGLFNQPQYNDKIILWLLKHGYDIGNHSFGHADFTNISYEQTVKEIGSMYQLLEQKTNGNYVNIVALPFGSPYKKTHANFDAILNGIYQQFSYQTKATLQVGWESNYSPFSKSFDPQFLKRIRAYDHNGTDFDIEFCFEQLKKNRYVSDGKKEQITILKKDKDYLDEFPDKKVIVYE